MVSHFSSAWEFKLSICLFCLTVVIAFASVVLKNDLKKNDLLCEKNIWVMRPGNGEIPASKYKSLIGKKANKDLFKGNQLKFTDIE